MKTFVIEFTGRENLAIGLCGKFKEAVTATDKEAAILKLYDKYEHIHVLSIVEVSPCE